MKRVAGFTIIELVIALSIMVFISMIAIPTYNNLILRQADIAEADQVVACLKQAQAYAAAPPAQYVASDMHFVQVSIASNGTSGSVCSIKFYSSGGVDIDANLANYTMPDISMPSVNSAPYIVYFDVTQKGLPVQIVQFSPKLVVAPLTSALSLNFKNNNQDTTISIKMGITGLPITVTGN